VVVRDTRELGALLILIVLALGGCESEPVELFVDLRTDLVPGPEFVGVRATLIDVGTTEEALAQTDGDYLEGVRIAEFGNLEPGQRSLVVTLVDAEGATVAERRIQVDQEGSFAVTVLVTRDCRDVSCDDPASQTCIGGRCGDVGCSELTPEACPAPECMGDAECAAGSACATARCEAGSCVQVRDDTMCAETEYCSPDSGCAPIDGSSSCTDIASANTVLWIDFEDDLADGASDRSGNGLDALCGPVCPTSGGGVLGQGLAGNFDGTDAMHLRVPSNPLLELPTGFTISAFVFIEANTSPAGYVSKALDTTGDNSFLIGHVGGGGLVFWSDSTASRHDLRTGNPPLSTWFQLVGTYDQATSRKVLYIDGTMVAEDDAVMTVDFDGSDVFISADDDDGGVADGVQGAIDDVRIFDRALTPSEVLALYECKLP